MKKTIRKNAKKKPLRSGTRMIVMNVVDPPDMFPEQDGDPGLVGAEVAPVNQNVIVDAFWATNGYFDSLENHIFGCGCHANHHRVLVVLPGVRQVVCPEGLLAFWAVRLGCAFFLSGFAFFHFFFVCEGVSHPSIGRRNSILTPAGQGPKMKKGENGIWPEQPLLQA